MMSRKHSKAMAGFVIEWDVDRAGVVSNRRTYRRQGGLVLPIKELINIKALLDLPWRWKHEPFTKGPAAGVVVTDEELAYGKQLYYKAKGWTEDGMIPKELLINLGMPDVAEEIGV